MDKLRRSLYRKKKNVIKDAYCFLDINDIVANKEQPRTHFEDEKIQELAESILETGQEKWITEMDTKELLDLFRLDV